LIEFSAIKLSLNMWSIEHETNLFKAVTRFKPAGLHKHFRMISIHNMVNLTGGEYVTSEEIWKKLNTLYNMAGLDDLEDNESGVSSLSSESPNVVQAEDEEDEDARVSTSEFRLPWEEYGELMIQQAKATDSRPSSPDVDGEANDKGEVEEEQDEEEETVEKVKEESSEDSMVEDEDEEEHDEEPPQSGEEAEETEDKGDQKSDIKTRATRSSNRSTRSRAAAAKEKGKDKEKEKDKDLEEESTTRSGSRLKRKAPPTTKAPTPRRSSRRK
jgi:Chromatin modification-related protein EAF7